MEKIKSLLPLQNQWATSMTDESNIIILESPIFLKLDRQVVSTLPRWHFIRELSETKLHIATKIRIPPEWSRNQAKYYKLLGDNNFYHEKYFRLILDTSVN